MPEQVGRPIIHDKEEEEEKLNVESILKFLQSMDGKQCMYLLLCSVTDTRAFDQVDRRMLWNILREQGYRHHLIECIRRLYTNTRIIINGWKFSNEQIAVNQRIRQGCSLSPTLFNIYIDKALSEWKRYTKSKGINLENGKTLNTLLYVDNLLIVEDSADKLQYSIHKLNQVCIKTSTGKTKVMAFHGTYPVRTKISVIEQISHFNYVGCDMSYEYNDINKKLSKY